MMKWRLCCTLICIIEQIQVLNTTLQAYNYSRLESEEDCEKDKQEKEG